MKINQNTTFSKKDFPKFTLLFISIMLLIDFCIWWFVPAQRLYSLIFLTGFIFLCFLIVVLRTKKLKTHFEPDPEESPFLLLTAWSIFWASALNMLCALWWGGGLFIRVMAGCFGLYATWKCSWIFYYTPESIKRIKLHLPDKRYLRKRGKEEETHYFSGVSYQDKGLYREAEEEYLKVIELNPEHYKAYHNLGYVCRKTGRTEEAIKYYKKALQINPQNSMSLFNLGIIQFFAYAGENGFDYFCKAIAADPTIEPHIHQFLSLYSYHTRQDIQKLHELLQRGCHDREERVTVEPPKVEVTTETPKAEKTLYETETYSNDKYRFSIKYPKDWALDILEPRPEFTVELSVWFGIRGKVACSIMVGPIGPTIYGRTLKELENRTRIHRQNLNANLLSSKRLTIDGIDAYEHKYTAEYPRRYVKQVGLFKDNDEYLLLFKVFSKEDFEKYESTFDDCIQSFKFKRGGKVESSWELAYC